MNYSKNHLNCFKYNIFRFHEFLKNFSWIYKNRKFEQQNSVKSLKSHLNCFEYNIFCVEKFSDIFVNIQGWKGYTIKTKILSKKVFSTFTISWKIEDWKIEKKKLRKRWKNYFVSLLSCLKMMWISLKNKKWRK